MGDVAPWKYNTYMPVVVVVVVVVVVYFERRNCPSLDALRQQIPFVTITVYSVGSVF